MAAGKSVSSQERAEPVRAGRRPAASPGGSPVLAQEQVLAEITHELGNFFHKLYYWADYLQEKRSGRSGDATATQMLGRTIQNLEGFLKGVLAYFQPLQIAPTRLGVGELIAGMLGHLRGRLDGTPLIAADADGVASGAVMVDAARFSHVAQVIARRLGERCGPGSRCEARCERVWRDGPGVRLDLSVHGASPAAALFQTAATGVEWALAERIVALHGGELTASEPADDEHHVVVFLPLTT
jgi:signal transduction histidine kinase